MQQYSNVVIQHKGALDLSTTWSVFIVQTICIIYKTCTDIAT